MLPSVRESTGRHIGGGGAGGQVDGAEEGDGGMGDGVGAKKGVGGFEVGAGA